MTKNTLKNRKGIVVIDRDIIIEYDKNILTELFSNVYPIHSNATNYWTSIEYHCVSPHFREIVTGEVTPMYEVIFEKDSNGIDRFKEVKEITP